MRSLSRRGVLAAAFALGAGAARGRPTPTGDLDGLWFMGTYTDLERPAALPRLVLTPAEAEAFEAPRRALNGMPASKDGALGQAESEFNDRGDGLLRVRGEIRASIITEPADGRIPYLDAAARAHGLAGPPVEDMTGPETRPLSERCLGSAAAGAPIVGGPDANLVQIVQAPGAIAIVSEKYHDTRIVRLGAAHARPAGGAAWMGDSIGRWDGATLVVETTRPHAASRGQRLVVGEGTVVSERFTRLSATELLYAWTVADPALFREPWRGETVWRRTPGRMFEYACHEGNYGLPGVLAGARREEREAVAAKAAP